MMSASEIMAPIDEMTSKTHQLIQYLRGVSLAYKTVQSVSVSKFFDYDVNISYLCKIILLNLPQIYW